MVINVKTQEQWDIILKYYSLGWAAINEWSQHGEETCIHIHEDLSESGFADIDYFVNIDRITPITFTQWLDVINKPMIYKRINKHNFV
jgi:hypothetical protein